MHLKETEKQLAGKGIEARIRSNFEDAVVGC
jgi:hypothetical protein